MTPVPDRNPRRCAIDPRGERAAAVGPVLLHNEFASVTAETEVRRGSTCLRLVDTRSGMTGLLDPIVLEALAWASRDELEAFTLGVLARTTAGKDSHDPQLLVRSRLLR